MVPFKTTSLTTTQSAIIGATLSAQGIIYARGGNSNQWNQAFNVATIVQSNSASWEESADILPTVTNFLSTNNVLVNTLSVSSVQIRTRGTSNVFIGNNTTGRDAATGNHNFVFGLSAGNALTSGINNVFIGNCAGRVNSSGNSNNFLGAFTGCSNTTGRCNNFFGLGAGRANTSGNANNFFGLDAGGSNTTGNNNNFLGSSAGFSNTTGFNNNFLGSSAGLSNTTGYNNNFFGPYAGFYNTTGIFNNFFGPGTGFFNNTGNSNNFFGTNAGFFNTTGAYNNFIGRYAGCTNTTGSNNTIIGNNANVATNSLSGVIVLGTGAVATQSHQIVLSTQNVLFRSTGSTFEMGSPSLVDNLTVFGTISGTQAIFASGGNSNQWNSTFTNVQSNSANWILDGGNTKNSDITIGTNNNFNLNFETANSTRVIVTSSGQTGFGGYPYAKVQYVLDDDTAPDIVYSWDDRHVQWGTGGPQAPGLGISYSSGDGTVNMAFLEPFVAWRNARMNFGTMSWYSGGTTLGLTQNGSGNVGIGTTTPTTSLEVSGTIKARKTETNFQDSVLKVISTESSAGTSWRGRVLIGAEDLTFLMGTYNGIAGLGAHSWTSANTEDGAAWADLTINPDGNANVYIGGSNWDNSTAIVTVQNSNRYVGLNTQTPSSLLDVYSSTLTKSVLTVNESTGVVNADQGFVVGTQVGGYVDSGGHKAQIVAPDATAQTPLVLAGGSAQMEFWKDSTPSKAVSFGMAVPGNSPENDLIFTLYNGSSWSEGFRVQDTTGNIGIGTTTPNQKLTVVGNISATGTIYAQQGNSGEWISRNQALAFSIAL